MEFIVLLVAFHGDFPCSGTSGCIVSPWDFLWGPMRFRKSRDKDSVMYCVSSGSFRVDD